MTELEEAKECWEQARDALCEISKDLPTSIVPSMHPQSLIAADAFMRYWRLRVGPRKYVVHGGERRIPRSPWP